MAVKPNPNCGNCDGRGCMGCVFREYDHDCKNDCPMCCRPDSDTVECVQVCDGCSSWTDRPVTRAEVLNEWGWVDGEEPESLYCPECE